MGVDACFFANMRTAGMFAITDPVFGAVGDGVHDDGAAILAATTAALAVQGSVIFPAVNPAGNPAVYLVSSTLVIQSPINWQGNATAGNRGPIIRAGASMRTILSLETTFGGASFGFDPIGATIKGLIFDGNNLVTRSCILGIGWYATRFEDVYCINSHVDGWSAAGRPLPLVLSAVTPGAGAPSGVTVSQPDNNSGFGMQLQTGTFTIVIKGNTPGNLNVGDFVFSSDGGATFSTVAQKYQSTVNLAFASGTSLVYPMGLQVAFPAQNYPANGTYTFTVGIQIADNGETGAVNTGAKMISCGAYNCGTVYETAGSTAAGNFPAFARQVIVAGTVSINSGSQIAQGSGTSFLSTGAREGDMLSVAGVAYHIACVLSDTQIAIASDDPPKVTLAAQDFSIKVGAGYWEDGATENNNSEIFAFRAVNCATGIRAGGLHGLKAFGPLLASATFNIAAFFGSSQQQQESFYLASADFESQSTAYVAGGVLGGTFDEFSHNTPFPLGPGPYLVIASGSTTAVNGPLISNPQNTIVWQPTLLTVVAATTISAPDQGVQTGSGHTSLVHIQANSAITMTSSPVIAAPTPSVNVKIRLQNVNFNPITIQHDLIASSNILLRSPQVCLGRGDCIDLTWEPNFAQWVEDNRSIYGFNSGSNCEFTTGVLSTTDNAFHNIYTILTGNALAPGTMWKYNVTAHARNGTDFACWNDCMSAFDSGNNNLGNVPAGLNVGLAPTFSTAGNAATWRVKIAPATPTATRASVQVQGDGGVNTVYFGIVSQPMVPPYAF